MRDGNKKMDRLFRSAALVGEDLPAAPPFGFETRVVALWRSGAGAAKPNGLANLLRRVALFSAAIAVVAAAAAFREVRQNREIGESNDFAIADSAIQSELGE